MGAPWKIEHTSGDAASFHARVDFDGRMLLFHEVAAPTLVLGSSQGSGEVDHTVTDALGIEVVSRRSGGGAVLVLPGECVWLDLVVPAGDPLWNDDVSVAMAWVGECWQAALSDLGMTTTVHAGALDAGAWGRRVCFASRGAGEVFQGQAKVVGVSQRRNRSWARFQTMCHLRWRPEVMAAVMSMPRPAPTDLAPVVATVGAERRAVRDALLAQLALR